jgi:hypothetical protein
METLAMVRQEFGEESINSRPRKARQVKIKDESMLIIFFDIKGIVHKEFILAGHTVNSEY